jgi:hypothetical protein
MPLCYKFDMAVLICILCAFNTCTTKTLPGHNVPTYHHILQRGTHNEAPTDPVRVRAIHEGEKRNFGGGGLKYCSCCDISSVWDTILRK